MPMETEPTSISILSIRLSLREIWQEEKNLLQMINTAMAKITRKAVSRVSERDAHKTHACTDKDGEEEEKICNTFFHKITPWEYK